MGWGPRRAACAGGGLRRGGGGLACAGAGAAWRRTRGDEGGRRAGGGSRAGSVRLSVYTLLNAHAVGVRAVNVRPPCPVAGKGYLIRIRTRGPLFRAYAGTGAIHRVSEGWDTKKGGAAAQQAGGIRPVKG